MEPHEIKAALIKKKVKLSDFAKEHAVTPSAVSQVIGKTRTSRRLQEGIAEKLDLSFEKVWGNGKRKAA